MKNLHHLHNIIHSEEVLTLARTSPRTFSISKKFTLPDIICFLASRNGNTTNQDIANFFSSSEKEPISKQAVFKALNKVNPEVFPFLFRSFAEQFYQENPDSLKGYTVLAVDGTFYDLPPAQELRYTYGGNTNAKIPVDKIKKPQAKGSILFDVINHLIVDASLAPYKTSELPLLYQHLENCDGVISKNNTLLLADRYYGSAELFLYCMLKGIKFCIRGKEYFYKKYVEAIERDGIIEIPFDKAWIRRMKRDDCKSLAQSLGSLPVRVVKNTYTYINKKQTEEIKSIYFTNLSEEEFSTDEIVSLYHTQRWEVETAYHVVKTHLEAERFNSAKFNIVTNEIYGKLLFYNIAGLFFEQANDSVQAENRKTKNKYEYLPNMKNITDILRKERRIWGKLIKKRGIRKRKNDWNSYIQGLVKRFAREKVPVRPGRHVRRWGRWVTYPSSSKFRIDGRRNPLFRKCFNVSGYISCRN